MNLSQITMALCEHPLNDQQYIYKVVTTKNFKKLPSKESECLESRISFNSPSKNYFSPRNSQFPMAIVIADTMLFKMT